LKSSHLHEIVHSHYPLGVHVGYAAFEPLLKKTPRRILRSRSVRGTPSLLVLDEVAVLGNLLATE